jgi:hypothetical protein
MHRCSWCDEHATVVLVGDSSSRTNHYACPTHHEQWGRLYRRSVRLGADDPVVDLRDRSEVRPAG